MPEQVVWCIQAFALTLQDCFAELIRIPEDDDCREQIQAGQTEMLTFCGPIPDLALTANPQGVLQGMMCFALIQSDGGPALHVYIERPFDDEQCPFDLSDFPHCDGQIVFARTG